MMIFGKKIGPAAAITCALALACGGVLASRAHALTPTVGLASHRAVYELTLAQSAHGNNSSTVSARGRILYDFAGSTCEGYKLEFRQVSELDNGEGKVTLSDLRSNTWEDGEAKNFHFTSENSMDQWLIDQIGGPAGRALGKPKDAKLRRGRSVVFPTEHGRRILDAARAGNSILEFPVYDGSEKGEK